jgi:hypothetical protein
VEAAPAAREASAIGNASVEATAAVGEAAAIRNASVEAAAVEDVSMDASNDEYGGVRPPASCLPEFSLPLHLYLD